MNYTQFMIFRLFNSLGDGPIADILSAPGWFYICQVSNINIDPASTSIPRHASPLQATESLCGIFIDIN